MSVTVDSPPAERLTGKEFQRIVQDRCEKLRQDGLAGITSYGVQAVRTRDDWMVIQSYPDFEGPFDESGRQAIFDAKACSQASWSLDKYRPETRGARSRQLRHMYERSRFGVVCFFLIHWNPRELKTKSREPLTHAFPVWVNHPFWERFDAGEIKSMTPGDCEEHAVPVPWSRSGKERVPRPDLMLAIGGVLRCLLGASPVSTARPGRW